MIYSDTGTEVIRHRVTLEAKRLLINLELCISETAYPLHFNYNSHFTKFFRKQVGITSEDFGKKP
jgi:AraC-like DNA-binding protein